jgi:hypothetical protein
MSEYLDDYIKDLAAEALKSRQLAPETMGPYGLPAEIALHYLAEEPEKLREFTEAVAKKCEGK